MRETLFRGKDAESGKWLYGWVFGEKTKTIIELDTQYISKEGFEAYCTSVVIPETVGQFTGLHDKNGVEIWEGDVVRIEHDITETQSLGSIENKDLSVWEEVVETFEVEDVVVFANGSFDVQEWVVGIFMPYEIEVVGNIYDNPELMEGKK